MLRKVSVLAFFLGCGLTASATTFTDESTWRAALTSFLDDNFQSYPANSDLTTDSLLGLNLSLSGQVGNPEIQDANIIGGLFHNGSLVLSNRGTNFTTLTITPASGLIYALGYWNVGLDDRTTLTAFFGETQLDQITTPASGNNLSFQGFISSTGATRVTVTEFAGNGYYTLDDLQVGTTAPEPGSAALLLGAFALAGAMLRHHAARG